MKKHRIALILLALICVPFWALAAPTSGADSPEAAVEQYATSYVTLNTKKYSKPPFGVMR